MTSDKWIAVSACQHQQGFDFDSLCYTCGADSSDVVAKLQQQLAELREEKDAIEEQRNRLWSRLWKAVQAGKVVDQRKCNELEAELAEVRETAIEVNKIRMKEEAELAGLRQSNTEYQRLYNEMAEEYSKQKRQLAMLRQTNARLHTELFWATSSTTTGEQQ